jgi:hypothetical protein
MMTFKEFLRWLDTAYRADDVVVRRSDGTLELLTEGRKFKSASYENDIGIDRLTHARSGELQIHVFDRKHRQVGVIKHDGSRSHNCKPFRLTPEQADVVRGLGVPVKKSRLIEAELVSVWPRQILLG